MNNSGPPQIVASGDFVRGFRPPEYLVDGILQHGFLYSCTAQTGHGKTAVMLRLMASVALGREFGGRAVTAGSSLMLAGENPDDVRARWIALSEQMGFDPDKIDAHFMPGIFSVPAALEQIRDCAATIGGMALVVVDTGAAYFEGEEENNNRQYGDYARQLRTLTTIAGRPCVVVNCHPVKNAGAENLRPRGGGAFLAEVDGNLTCVKSDNIVQLHHQGKFRGPDFEPCAFELAPIETPQLVNSSGRQMPTVVARPVSESDQVQSELSAKNDLRKLLTIISEKPDGSIANWAHLAGWRTPKGDPLKSKVSRLLKQLQAAKFVTQELGVWKMTAKGRQAAQAR